MLKLVAYDISYRTGPFTIYNYVFDTSYDSEGYWEQVGPAGKQNLID